MFILGFLLGLTLGFGFWVWQQLQFSLYLQCLLQSASSRNYQHIPFSLVLWPRLRQKILALTNQRETMQDALYSDHDLLDSAPLGYLQVDEENQLLWCNVQAREILSLQRWQPGQVRLLLELVRSYELDQVIEQTRDWQKPQVREWVFHPSCEDAMAMKQLKSLRLRASSCPLQNGQVGVFLENCQQVLDLYENRDRSFSDLAHELRTPLTSIKLVAETLQYRLEPPLDRWVNRLMQEIDRLINLVQSWLDLTQMENNPTMRLNLEVVEMRSLVLSAYETLEPIAEKQSLQLSCTIPEDIYIRVDKARIYQVFLNLIDNSIKYSPNSATINIKAEVLSMNNSNNSKQVEINIIDSGFGFDEADLPHVFERFYRGDKARYRSSNDESSSNAGITGNGLGLAIVQQIILAHNGCIKAMNHPKTGGAWIQINLPLTVSK
ncbi:HAMP domain-containing histidine kinase [Anabaena sp. FACHB-1237]|uniref:sensor histidine kinase n=1 Tax=Anabaena sp. FACHB-1237 TaxID=2692769 RepID=UPI0016803C82|nr:HAMP domain-containing sensor histidine kinase [Anabaena sp. FACHB-1237]MBD2138424.1 HAMP domain-containing histidine kinase [Anabaena sp. FACHB-1237]